MNKLELIKKVKEELSVKTAEATEYVNTFLTIIEESLSKGETVNIHNFGKFAVVDRAEKKGRNPQTGEDKMIPAHKAVQFTVGKGLKSKVKK